MDSPQTLLYAGTAKGLFILEGDRESNSWRVAHSRLKEHDISALAWDKRTPEIIMAGTANGKLFISRDGGLEWEATATGLDDKKIWSITPDPNQPPGTVFIGVDGGYLLYSPDYGSTFQEITGLRQMPETPYWFGPFGAAIFHTILPVPQQPGKIYLGLSVVGVLVSDDDGISWQDTTANIPRVGSEDPNAPKLADIHKLAMHSRNPTRMYATTHYGTYRSDDGSLSWEDVSEGLPFAMTRPLALHPTNPDTVFVIAHEDSPDNELPIIRGALRVHRSRNAGKNWEAIGAGLPDKVECSVLREALVVDEAEPCGVYLGNNRGHVFVSADEGDNWRQVANLESSIRVIRVR